MKDLWKRLFPWIRKTDEIHKRKSEFNTEILKLQQRQREVIRKSESRNEYLRHTTGYKYAVASGGKERGLK